MFGQTQDAGAPSEDESKQIFNIKDLTTKSVTLYPTRAHITRVIDNVFLKPGTNEIEISGLSPTVDEHSVQIEGQGAATVIDLSVQLVPNHDIFEEIYPDENESSDSESSGGEDPASEDEEAAVRKISKELKNLQVQVTEITETQNSATERLATLDRYAKSFSAEHYNPEDITKLLGIYDTDRAKIFEIHTAATEKLANLKKQIKRKELEKTKAGKEGQKAKEKKAKQKAKDRRRKRLQKAEKRKETQFVKQERLRYWAKKVYKVTLLLEGPSLDTPGSSRRNSLVTLTEEKAPKSLEAGLASTPTPVSLLLSYVTKEAGWSPRYDLRISSLQKTATIIYRTEFLNRTSETWKDAKLSFSTSQTSYQGLDDVVPFMHAWRIKLSRYESGDGGLLSTEEANKPRGGRTAIESFNRGDVFGLDDNYIPSYQQSRPLQVQQKAQQYMPPPGMNSWKGNNTTGGLFGSSRGNNAVVPYGSSAPPPPPNMTQQAAIWGSHQYREEASTNVVEANRHLDVAISSARAKKSMGLFGGKSRKEDTSERHSVVENYDPTIEDAQDDLDAEEIEFEESSWEDNGLTATYDVPGVRTLAPSSMTRRHKIASLNATSIHLSHICVPKLRSAAFLRAKIRNPSNSVTLLKGSAGVTLDGSFFGNMTLPRVSPGQVFDLPLGVDPAIHINYPKPSVHRSTQGIIFNKESAQVFTRSIWVNNTKSQPVELLVLDQVPVSEDERLRIVITTPRGLSKEGDSVKAGVSAKEGSSGAVTTTKSEAWGNAVAKMKKNGELNWTVKLEKGQGCLLKLDYEARLPPSEKIIPA
ncbi:hypothetical protein P154DRAFT_527306 [Amniculicola lignicola CBS 123094]|uniref:DUF4139 domain-containing protein n=1 Tax=Amniculicola lignicola CBS 123094 TaxID=1392246 RepID=A0A6A5VYJ2_9PLEO|nr:hypothetical protein P154DRAFT_527306 [Amniculicola lignicola CBS 123094]